MMRTNKKTETSMLMKWIARMMTMMKVSRRKI